MKAHAVIGSSYGDEGKGITVDYLCSKLSPDYVVRWSGAQSGHTVITPDGKRHVFHHYGAGTYLDVPTFLSQYFIVNPILFAKEEFPDAHVTVHPDAIVTTPMDMLINQAYEKKLGRYASCGVGINETARRSYYPEYRLVAGDMLDRVTYEKILHEYTPRRIKELGLTLEIEEKWESIFYDHAYKFLDRVHIAPKPAGKMFVFEGSQGLCLSQLSRDFPYVTHAHTGMRNVFEMCAAWGITDIHATYVTRSYLTRHGAGPLPYEQPLPDWVKDETNINHEFQGKLRYAPLGIPALEIRVIDDAKGIPFELAVTCMDQNEFDLKKFTLPVAYASYGPTRTTMEDLRVPKKIKKKSKENSNLA